MSTTPTGFISVPRGLAKVVVTDTELGDVRGDEGFFHYRQYSAVELAERVGFEQAWHLLERGHLPDGAELAAFTAEVGRLRVMPPGLADLLPAICATTTSGTRKTARREMRPGAPAAGWGAKGVAPRRRASTNAKPRIAPPITAGAPTCSTTA